MQSFAWKPRNFGLTRGSTSSDEVHKSIESLCAEILPSEETHLLKLDDKKDVAFCAGIDKLLDASQILQSIDEYITRDAEEMSLALNKLGLDSSRVKLSLASNRTDDCTKAGLRHSFIENAKLVANGGNFIFYFAGHGFESNRCVLVPADFKSTEDSGISGDDLAQWLVDAKCEAKNVLFIFDCCYAGILGDNLVNDKQLQQKIASANMSVFAMCGCEAKETLLAHKQLKHSIFAYFLLDYIKMFTSNKEFDVKQAMNDISIMCYNLSSLIHMYDIKEGHSVCAFNPTLHSSSSIRPRSLPSTTTQKAIISELQKYFIGEVRERLHEKAANWIGLQQTKQSLSKLCERAKLSDSGMLLKCLVSVLVCSLAVLQYEYDVENRELLEKEHLFLVIAIMVSNAIDMEVTIDHVKVALEDYINEIEKLGLDYSALQILQSKLSS